MRRLSFGRSLGFAALAAALSVPAQLFGSLCWGYEGSLARYLLGLVPFALLASAPNLRTGVRAGVLAALSGAALACTDPALGTALLGALVGLGSSRCLVYGASSLARSLAVELGLGVLAAGSFALFSDGRLIGDAFAVWCFWLVQSGFALIQHTPAPRLAAHGDRFEAALAAAERLMESSH